MPPAPTLPAVGWGWRAVGSTVAFVLAGALLLLLLLRAAAQFAGLDISGGMTSPPLYAASILIYALVGVGVYLFAARDWGWQALGLRAPPFWAIAITPLLFVVELGGLYAINLTIARLQGGEFDNPQVAAISNGEPFDAATFWMLFVLIALVAPVAEELFFRGMLYPVVRKRWSAPVAIVISAALFAAFHFIPLIFPALFFVGLLLGFLREASGSTIPCIVLHMIQNGVMLLGISLLLSQPGL